MTQPPRLEPIPVGAFLRAPARSFACLWVGSGSARRQLAKTLEETVGLSVPWRQVSNLPRVQPASWKLAATLQNRISIMKRRLLTPGPSPVPEETLLELARPVPYHRTAEFRRILAEVTEDLQYVFRTKNPVFTLTASGTGAM